MDTTTFATLLGGLGALLGAVAMFYQSRGARTGDRLDIAFQMQEKRISELTVDKNDLQVRLRETEKDLKECKEEKYRQDLVSKEHQNQIDQMRVQIELLKMKATGDG